MADLSFNEGAFILGALVFVAFIWRSRTRKSQSGPGRPYGSHSTDGWAGDGGDFGGGDCGGGGG